MKKSIIRTLLFFGLIISLQGNNGEKGPVEINFQRVVIDTYGPKDPFGKAIGDINGDGFIDVVVGGFTDSVLVWYKNPGKAIASWPKYTITEGQKYVTDHETADIDLDGQLDLVVLTEQFIAWYKNDGSAEDGAWEQIIIENRKLHDIEVNDYDGDGDQDVIGRNHSEWDNNGNALHFYEQISPVSWVHSTRECPHGEGLLAVDIDGDGKKDIVTGNRWYKNSGSMKGSDWLENTVSKSWTYGNVFIAFGDINRDGLEDIILSPSERVHDNYRISWFEHPKNSTDEWAEHLIEDSVQAVYHFIGCGDFNLDGSTDIVTAEMHHGNDPDEVLIYANNGGGKSWTKNVLWSRGSHSCRVFDFDNDGDLDFFGANYRGSEINLWVNKIIQPAPLPLDKWHYKAIDNSRDRKFMGLAFGDLNGDGKDDIASGKWIYFNPGEDMSGDWLRKTLPIEVDILLTVDVDEDNNPDLIAEDSAGLVYWLEMKDISGEKWNWRKVGDVGKANHSMSSQGYELVQVETGGKPEIVIVGGEQPEGAIYYFKIPANPDTHQWPRITVAASVYPEGVGYGDLDGDGDVDLAGTSDVKNNVAWYENPGNGEGNWKKHEVGLLEGSDRFRIADVDSDGHADIVATGANRAENGIYWFKAPTDPVAGKWERNVVVNTGTENSMNSMDIVDMDLDGDIDIVSGTHRGALKISIWENNGKGKFAERVVDQGKESHLGARVNDLDGDGDPDIVSIAWDTYSYLHLWRNDAVK